jgi:hypothetical protein
LAPSNPATLPKLIYPTILSDRGNQKNRIFQQQVHSTGVRGTANCLAFGRAFPWFKTIDSADEDNFGNPVKYIFF